MNNFLIKYAENPCAVWEFPVALCCEAAQHSTVDFPLNTLFNNQKTQPAAGARFSGDAGNRPENIFCHFHKSLPDGGFRYCENHESLPHGGIGKCHFHEPDTKVRNVYRHFHESDTKVENVYRHFHESDTKVENVYRHFHKLRQNGRNCFSKNHNGKYAELTIHGKGAYKGQKTVTFMIAR